MWMRIECWDCLINLAQLPVFMTAQNGQKLNEFKKKIAGLCVSWSSGGGGGGGGVLGEKILMWESISWQEENWVI